MSGGDGSDLVEELEIKLRNLMSQKYNQMKLDIIR